ncbi:TetR/AcrR family transcriptional regulator [Pollutimonas sp. H1-120]|uniref:TetR/AcrR family transcriptional regulator n=1 Tax=Pollutimonas sp. H1-120 TaxID=3148824 RepID=UPI003B522918
MTKTSSPPSKSPSHAIEKAPAEDPKAARKRVMTDARRALILDAARATFFELGIEKTSIREIAQRAGYTPGALYSYFTSKEAVYGALLSESLERLNEEVAAASAANGKDLSETVRVKARAFFDFYRRNPRDLDLGFYLFQGMQPRGLTPSLNESLNARLRDSLRPAQDALRAMGMSEELALAEITALFAHTVGLLMLSHTGRIRMFKQGSQELFNIYLDQLLERGGLYVKKQA